MGRVPTRDQRFTLLFETYSDHVQRYTASLVYGDEVDDVFQRTFMTAWEHFDDIPAGAEQVWLLGVVRNHCKNSWRTGRRAAALVDAIEHARPKVSVEASEHELDRAEVSPLLQALGELSRDECDLMVLTGWLEMTPTELATMFEQPSGTIRQRLFRARKTLSARYVDLCEAG